MKGQTTVQASAEFITLVREGRTLIGLRQPAKLASGEDVETDPVRNRVLQWAATVATTQSSLSDDESDKLEELKEQIVEQFPSCF